MKKTVVKLRKDTVAGKFAKLNKVDKEIKALDQHLKRKGFRPQKEKRNFWGIKGTYEDNDRKATFSVVIQDYTKPKSKDGAAIGQVTVAADGRSEVYSFDLIAPEGKVEKAKEYRVDKKLKVMEAESWWSCVQGELNRQCGSILVNCLRGAIAAAVAGGPLSWATFLSWLAGCIGVPFAKIALCCGCNCSWWCSWAVGCCRQ